MPQDLLLLVYKCVQSVKLLLLRVTQAKFCESSEYETSCNGSVNVSQIRFWLRSRKGSIG